MAWTKVVATCDKYVELEVKMQQLLEGSNYLVTTAVTSLIQPVVDPNKFYYLSPDGQPIDLSDFNGVLRIANYNQAPQCVITGLETVEKGVVQHWSARQKEGKFIGYFNETDTTRKYAIDSYLVKGSVCKALVVCAVDGCSYKALGLNTWAIPTDKTVSDVQTLLKAKADPLKTADKSSS